MPLPTRVPPFYRRYSLRNFLQDLLDEVHAAGGEGMSEAIDAAQDLVQNLPAKIKVTVVAGAAAGTNIAIPGIDPADDTVLAVVQHNVEPDTGTAAVGTKIAEVVDLTDQVSIPSAGNIQLSSATTGDRLIVTWYDADAVVA